jgi:hypothetical protein
MQNKIIIPTIITCAIILTGIVAMSQYNSNKVVGNLNSSSSGSEVSSIVSSSSSLAISSVVSSVDTINSISSSSTAQKSSESSVIPKSETPKTPDQPIQDIPNVTKLSTDKSIYHQYIKDYLACPTKFYQPLNGGYIYDGLDDYQYLCIPQSEADKCPSKTLTYGHKPLVGQSTNVVDGTGYPPGISKTIELNKYYCTHFFESIGSVSIDETSGYGLGYFPTGLDAKLPGYFAIPKSNISIKDEFKNSIITFAAIPLSSFSIEDQNYISQNFKVQ